MNDVFKHNKIPNIFRTLVPGMDEVGTVLLGNPAYPLLPHVMNEYAQCKTESEILFNQMLRDLRNPI